MFSRFVRKTHTELVHLLYYTTKLQILQQTFFFTLVLRLHVFFMPLYLSSDGFLIEPSLDNLRSYF